MTDWPSNATQIPPNAMNAEARMSELASILAAGLVRLRAANVSAPVGLAIPPRRSVYGLTNPSPQGEQP